MQRAAVIVVLLVILVLLGLGLYAACGQAPEGQLVACVRDVAIIVLVLETFVVTLLMLVLVLLFSQLVTTIRQEIMPILRSAKRTVDTVQGTTTFVTDSVVAPIISAAGLVSGVRHTLMTLISRGKAKKEA